MLENEGLLEQKGDRVNNGFWHSVLQRTGEEEQDRLILLQERPPHRSHSWCGRQWDPLLNKQPGFIWEWFLLQFSLVNTELA